VNVLNFEFFLENLVVDCVVTGQDLCLTSEVVWTKRHFHEEILCDFTHTFQIWMHVVLGDGRLFSLWITDHGPSVDDMSSWNISQGSNFKDCLLHVCFLCEAALRSVRYETSIFLFISCNVELVFAGRNWYHQEDHWSGWQFLSFLYKFGIGINKLALTVVFEMRVHGSEGKENKVWQ